MRTLVEIADSLADGRLDIAAAEKHAREVTAERIEKLSTGPAHVHLPMYQIEEQLRALSNYVSEHAVMDPRRWAGTFVLMHAQLGICQGEPTVEEEAVKSLAHLVDRVVQQSGGYCPAEVSFIAEAMIDVVLEHQSTTDLQLQGRLLQAKGRFRQCMNGQHQITMSAAFDVVIASFDHEGWQYYADRTARKARVCFVCPLGSTTLVCSIPRPHTLVLVAVDVARISETHILDDIERYLVREHPGIIVHRDTNGGMVLLEYVLEFRNNPLKSDDVVKAIICVNGAAEALLMLTRR